EINGHAFTARETGIVHELRIPVFVAATGDTIDKNITLSAIIDTGATNCAITSKVAQKIGALPIGMIDVSGVHGVDNVQLYAFDMLLPSDIFLQDVPALLPRRAFFILNARTSRYRDVTFSSV
ncbi:MAG: aspartyl protease family protein, partial [Desulfovibrionaceae bacterium]|nr:aspartyl protease family protein [Desulfovibrionaceae bacterium]